MAHPTASQTFRSARISRVVLRAPRPSLPITGATIAIDGPRQWLHVGAGKAIRTYHAGSGSLISLSPDYLVDEWTRLRTDPRKSDLLMLGTSGANQVVYRSQDGGQTGTQVASMAAGKALIERDSERGKAVLLTQSGDGTADGAISYQRSDDGGVTWGTATACALIAEDGSSTPLVATLLDSSQDPRRAALNLVCGVGSGSVVLESKDVGAKWIQKASLS